LELLPASPGPASPKRSLSPRPSAAIDHHGQLSQALPWNDWEIRPEEIEIAKRPDGSDWLLGSGGFGRVGVQGQH
jgi:hypothetical protein